MKRTARWPSIAALLLLSSACATVQREYTYGDVSPLLAPDLDVTSPLWDRFPGYAVLATSDPDHPFPVRGTGERGVEESVMGEESGKAGDCPGGLWLNDCVTWRHEIEVQVFAEEREAVSHYRHLCRIGSYQFEEGEVRYSTVPDGEACVSPYHRERGDAHGAWSWESSFEAAAVVRRARLVVGIVEWRHGERGGVSGISGAAASIADALRARPASAR